jgi:cell division protein FtsQ
MATKAKHSARAAVPEDPRISTRRKSVERSKRRKWLWILGAVGLVVVLALGGWVVLHRSWFSAKTIDVTGATHESPAQVIKAAGLAGHPPLISISTSAAAQGIERLAWVKTASVTKRWPSTVDISLTERRAVGTVKLAQRWYLVDETGRLLASYASQPYGQLLIVVPPTKDPVVGGSLGPAAQPALAVASSLPVAFKDQVAAVVGHLDATVTLRLTSPVKIELGTATELHQKYEDVAAVIAGATLHPGDVVDVSVPQASTITGP